MASVYDLKPRFQSRLRPLVGRLATMGATANQVTVAAALLSIGWGAWLTLSPSWLVLALLPVLLFVRMALNAIDGMLAREHGQKSRLGALLNELGDVVSDAALYLPLGLATGVAPLLAGAVATLAATSEVAGVAAIGIGASRRYDGPMGKSDRATVMGSLGLLLAVGLPARPWADIVFVAVAVLLIATTANRVRAALAETGE